MSNLKYCLRILLIIISISVAAQSLTKDVGEDDLKCAHGLKSNLQDPQEIFSSWKFTNTTPGYVCSFTGVSCWNLQDNRILSISLPSSSLSGSIPSSLQFCRSVTSLDLSSNDFSGSIPPLCDWLPFLVSLDLSGNQLSGPIPSELANCRFLNSLKLSSNNLSGSIPSSLFRLDRLKTLDLSNNNLSGPIPALLYQFGRSSFSGNPLLGRRRHPFSDALPFSLTFFVYTNVVACSLGFACSFFLLHYFYCKRSNKAEEKETVTLFEEPLVPLTVRSLVKAAGNFNPDNIIKARDIFNFTTYKAILTDGSELAVKRIQSCSVDDATFNCEMNLLSQLRHPNLLSLLGFCSNGDERLLLYKHMPGGSLYDTIHANPCLLDWPSRLNISIGVASGVALLHHGLPMPFVHENINSQSIVLDDDFEPRLTNYCLAGITDSLYVGDYSTKSDVYDFGLLMLELLTGKKPTDTTVDNGLEIYLLDLVDWVKNLEAEGRILNAVDSYILGKGYDHEILQFYEVAVRCLADLPDERLSMNSAYKSLRKIGGLRHCAQYFVEYPLRYRLDE